MSAMLNGGVPVTSAAVQAALAGDAAGARGALDLGAAALLDAGEADADVALRGFVAAMAGALVGSSFTMRPGAVGALLASSLASTDVGALTYDAGTMTLTATADGAPGVPLGVSILVAFRTTDQARSGIYTVTDEGAVDRPFVMTRRADFDASGDFEDKLTFLIAGFGDTQLFRMHVGGGFVLDTDPVTFELISVYVPPRNEVANLPAVAEEGATAFASDGRKVGESTGAGTGVPVYFSQGAWRVYATDAAVAT